MLLWVPFFSAAPKPTDFIMVRARLLPPSTAVLAPLTVRAGGMTAILFLLSTFSLPAEAAGQDYSQTGQATVSWSPDEGQDGVDVSVAIRIRYDAMMQEPMVHVTGRISKGGNIYYNGQRLTRTDVGEKAWNAISLRMLNVAADIYQGNNRVSTVIFPNVIASDVSASPDWSRLFPGVSGDRAKELFRTGFSIRNIRITSLSVGGMGEVGNAVRAKEKASQYASAIQEADRLFEQERLEDARSAYDRAYQIERASYPEQQIERIDRLLKEARQQEREAERPSAPPQGANSVSPQSSGSVSGASQNLADLYRLQWERRRASQEKVAQAQQEFAEAAAPLVAAVASEVIGAWERRQDARAREEAEQRAQARRDLLDQYYREVAYRLGDIYGYYSHVLRILSYVDAWHEFDAALERGPLPPLSQLILPRYRFHSPVYTLRSVAKSSGERPTEGDSLYVFALGFAPSAPIGGDAEMMDAQIGDVAETIRGMAVPTSGDYTVESGAAVATPKLRAIRARLAAQHPFPALTVRWGPVVGLPADALNRFASTLGLDDDPEPFSGGPEDLEDYFARTLARNEANLASDLAVELEDREHHPLDRAILGWLSPETASLSREDYLLVAATSRSEAEDLRKRLTDAPPGMRGGGPYQW